MASFTKEQIEAALEAKSRHLNQYNLRQIASANGMRVPLCGSQILNVWHIEVHEAHVPKSLNFG